MQHRLIVESSKEKFYVCLEKTDGVASISYHKMHKNNVVFALLCMNCYVKAKENVNALIVSLVNYLKWVDFINELYQFE